MKLNFERAVREWWDGLTPSQLLKAIKWIYKHPPPKDWSGSVREWAYLNMPPEVTQ